MPARKVVKTETPPDGLIYVPEFLCVDDEQRLLETFDGLEFKNVVMHGVTAKRFVAHFGYDYGYDSWEVQIQPATFPAWLADLRDRAAGLGNIEPAKIEQALVAKYPAGAGIGWHRDAPPFGPTVIGISIGSEEIMRFRRVVGDHFEMYKQPLARRSLYVLSKAARSSWQHSLPPAGATRYSITFRTVRDKYRTSSGQAVIPATSTA